MPRSLLEAAHQDGRRDWLATIAETVGVLTRQWSLQEVGEPSQPGGTTAWVAPAIGKAGEGLVLKVAWRHTEAAHEADGLRQWDGNGAVRLFAAEEFDDTAALLLERCTPGMALASAPEPEQDTVIAGLLRRLWRDPEPGQPFRPLQVMCDAWADEFVEASATAVALDRGLAREGVELLRTLPTSAERHVLLCTDLHAGNVLAAQREPWLVIDPKPYVGDPTYDPVQHLLNCDERLLAEPRDFPRRIADFVGVDPDRLLLWLFARCMLESLHSPALAAVARRVAR